MPGSWAKRLYGWHRLGGPKPEIYDKVRFEALEARTAGSDCLVLLWLAHDCARNSAQEITRGMSLPDFPPTIHTICRSWLGPKLTWIGLSSP